MQFTPKRRASVDILQSAMMSLTSQADHQLDADDLDMEEDTELSHSLFQKRQSAVITGTDLRAGGAGPRRPSMQDNKLVAGSSQAGGPTESDSIADATGLLATNRPELIINSEQLHSNNGASAVPAAGKRLLAARGKSSSGRQIPDQQFATLVSPPISEGTPAAVRRASIMLKAAALLSSQDEDDHAAEAPALAHVAMGPDATLARGRANSRMDYLFGGSDALLSQREGPAVHVGDGAQSSPATSTKPALMHPTVQLPTIRTADLPQTSPMRAGPKTPSFVPPLLLSPNASPVKSSNFIEPMAGLAFKSGKRRESISLADPLLGSPEPSIGSAKTRRESIPPVHPSSAPPASSGWDALRGVVREPLEGERVEVANGTSALASAVQQLVRHNTEARVSRSSNASEALVRLRRASIDKAASDEIQAVAAFTAKRLSMTTMTPTNSRAAMHLRGRSSFVVDPSEPKSQAIDPNPSTDSSNRDKEGAESDEEDVEVLNSSRISALNTQRLTARHSHNTGRSGPLLVATVVDSPAAHALATTVIHDKPALKTTFADAGGFNFPSASPVSAPYASTSDRGSPVMSLKTANLQPSTPPEAGGERADPDVNATLPPRALPSPESTLQHASPQSTQSGIPRVPPSEDGVHAATSQPAMPTPKDAPINPTGGQRSNRTSIALNNGDTLFLPFPATFTSGDAGHRPVQERSPSFGEMKRNPRSSGFGASTQAWAAKYDTTPTLPAYPRSARHMVIHTPSSFSITKGRGGRTLRKSTAAVPPYSLPQSPTIQLPQHDMVSPMAHVLHDMCTVHLTNALRFATVVEPPWDGYNIHAQDFIDAALLMARELCVTLQTLHTCIAHLATAPHRSNEFSLIQPLCAQTSDSTATHVLQSCSASFNAVALQRIEERRYTSACGILVLAALIFGAPNEVPSTDAAQNKAVLSMTDGLAEASAQLADTRECVAADPIRCLLQSASHTSQWGQLHAESCSVISAVLNNTACVYSRMFLYSQAVECLNAAVAIETGAHANKAGGFARPYTLKNLSLVYACVAGDLNAAASLLPASGPIVSQSLHPQMYTPATSLHTPKPR